MKAFQLASYIICHIYKNKNKNQNKRKLEASEARAQWKEIYAEKENTRTKNLKR